MNRMQYRQFNAKPNRMKESREHFYPVIPKPAEYATLSTEVDTHAHGYLQVVIGLQGKIEFDVNGVGNHMRSGQGCIVTPNSNHAFGGVDGPSDILLLNLLPESAENHSAMQRMYDLAMVDCYFGLAPQTIQLIQMLAKEIQNNPDDELLCQACNHTIIALLKKHAIAFQSNDRVGRLNMDMIDSYIAKHLQNKISVGQLAGSVFLSESQFHQQFKKQTGFTPHQYLLIKRIESAKQLIASRNTSLSHVSDQVGFSHPSLFTHAFSKHEGISPSLYKKRYWS